MIRRTTMLFTVYPPTTELFGWMDYVKRFQQQMTLILWCRVVRKTPRDRIVGNCELLTRQIRWKRKATGSTISMAKSPARNSS